VTVALSAVSSPDAPDDDVTLVERTLGGDAGAYAQLMRRHFDAAFAAARRLTTTEQDAEDACQEAFTRAYFRLERCGAPERFRGWLLQIVRHHAHNVRRYQALREAASLEDLHDPPKVRTSRRHLESADVGEHLRRALATLSPVKRAVVVHHDVDGWTHAQIAQALSISVFMSRRHLSDARNALRSLLSDVAKDFFEDLQDDE
jgi:RNA polymerase sigma-70 factor, ECF subfamily